MVGERVSHYRVLELVGSGGMGVVYKAEDTRLGRCVALKFLSSAYPSGQLPLERFRREMRAASALNHPHICTLYDVGEHQGQPFLVLEFLEGATLKDRLEAGMLSLPDILEYSIQIVDGLEAAHSQGIIHRDIKPANILITQRGQAKILDFGLAKISTQAAAGVTPGLPAPDLESEALTRPGAPLGTMAYMSPEQARGEETDLRSDLFSFGVVLYQLVTGRLPFPGLSAAAALDGILNRSPIPAGLLEPALPAELDQILLKLLEKDPRHRYPSAADLKADLERLRLKITAPMAAGPPRQTFRPVRKLIRKPAVLGSAALLVLLTALVFLFYQEEGKALNERDLILIADFVNRTGDDVFDGTLKQGLAVQLEQSPFLNVFPEERVREVLRYMGRPPDQRVNGTIGREICQRQGIKALLVGEIAPLGRHYVISVRAIEARSGEPLTRQQVEAESKEEVLKALGMAASLLRQNLGESLQSIERFDRPIEQATTSSLEALKAYSMGNERRAAGAESESVFFFERALELDPDFAMAHARLGTVYLNVGKRKEALESLRHAYQLRERVSQKEQFYISARYHTSVTRNLTRARLTYRLWRDTYPRDWVPHNNLALYYRLVGLREEALESARLALKLAPNQSFVYSSLVSALFSLNQFEEARAALLQAAERGVDSPVTRTYRFRLALMEEDFESAQTQTQQIRGTPLERAFIFLNASASAFSGQLAAALKAYRWAAESAMRFGLSHSVAEIGLSEALTLWLFGRRAEAVPAVERALQVSSQTEILLRGAVLLAWAGQSERAEALVKQAAGRAPEDTIVQQILLPIAQASIAFAKRRPERVIQILEPAGKYDYSESLPFFSLFLRGQAHLQLGDGAAAVGEFEKIVENRGISSLSPVYSAAHVGLARALALLGDGEGSRSAYQAFLNLCKDADPDVPLILQARKEYREAGLAGTHP